MEKEPSKTSQENVLKSKLRSPNYPAYGLKEAVEEAQTLFSYMGRQAVGRDIALKHIGYKATSGSGKMHMAALRAYALLDSVNATEPMVKLSVLARDIVTDDYPPSHPARLQAIKKAALAPKLHKELWDKWGANLPPDDEIRRFLIRERHFNDKSISDFITEYKGTIAFANLTQDDTVEEEIEESDSNGVTAVQAKAKQPDVPRHPIKQPNVAIHDAWNGPCVKLDLPRGNMIEIRLKSKVTPEEFKKIKQIYELSALSLIEDQS